MKDYSDWMKGLLKDVRYSLANSEGVDDETAKRIIEDKVFGCGQNLSLEESINLIEKLYEKTRVRLGILQKVEKDENVNEIMVNGHSTVFVERLGKIEKTNLRFDTEDELEEVIHRIASEVHREINELNPILDARLDDGSRIHAVHKSITGGKNILTVRKFRKTSIKMVDLIRCGTLNKECANFLRSAILSGMNIFVSGGTSSGKTTFLNALAEYIPQDKRVIIIEDSRELMLNDIENVVQMECRNGNVKGEGEVNQNDLIRASLRMRPDMIIVGEIRGREVQDMLQALNTGHVGMSTGHGNSIMGMLRRMEAMYISGGAYPIDFIRKQIVQGMEIMVQLKRFADGRRMVVEIAELMGFEDGEYRLNEIYVRDMHDNNGAILEKVGEAMNGKFMG